VITAETISEALGGKPYRDGFLMLCPAHEDINPSLSVTQKGDKVLVKCFGGCGQARVIEELKKRDLWPSPNGGRAQTQKPRIVATSDFTDPDGKLLYQEVKFEPKDFRSRRPDGKGGWIYNLTGVQRVLYRLPEVIKAEAVGICEGPKDCDALVALGFAATTNPNGAGKWRDEFDPYFEGKKVAIFPDNDGPGRAHAEDVARHLHRVAAVLKVVELAGLPPKGDLSDWIAAGGTAEQLQALVKAAPEWQPQALQETTVEPTAATETHNLNKEVLQPEPSKKSAKKREFSISSGFNLTDIGNGKRLAARHGQILHYCYPWSRWLIYDDRRWLKDDLGEIDRLGKDTVQAMYVEAAQIQDQKQREALAQHALRSESEAKRKAMISSAQSESGIPLLPEHLDQDPWLFNVLNGTIDLRTGELRPHRKEDMITKLAQVIYDATAECPSWWKFLERIFDRNFDIILFLQKAVGYALTGITWEQCLFFLYGLGANGKSTLIEIIQALFCDYATRTPTETFLAKKGNTIPNDVAALRGARFVSAVEVEAGRRLAEVLVKEMTGGDRLSARFMRAEWFEFKPEFKIFLAANHKPVIRGTDWAIWRRIHLIPFKVQIPREEQDKQLPEKLKRELSGILNWAIDGCFQWQHEGLTPPQSVQEATQEYREEMDIVGSFLAECCIVDTGAFALASELYKKYTSWAEESGEKKPFSQKVFGLTLAERGFERGRGQGGKTVWKGIGVKD
jgi:putative DNA primase/helicase